MTTANEKLFDKIIRHQTYILRYAAGLSSDVIPIIAKTEKELFSEIVRLIDKLDGRRTLTGKSGRKWQKEFSEIILSLREPAWDEIYSGLSEELKEFAATTASTTGVMLSTSSPVVLSLNMPPVDKLYTIVNSQPFEGQTLKEWMLNNKASDVRRILKASKIGITQGRTPTEIARDIVGTRKNSVSRKAFKDVESVVLTVTNGIQNDARQALYEANSDIIKKEKFSATLDSSTTFECASNDGKVFPQGEGPVPPLHFRCRSTRVPIFEDSVIGDRPYNSSTELELVKEYSKENKLGKIKDRGSLPYGHKVKFDKFARTRKRDLIGQVPSDVTFNEWLGRQTKSFQDQYLGPTRAKLFREKKFTLDRFVNSSGKTITLDDLNKSA